MPGTGGGHFAAPTFVPLAFDIGAYDVRVVDMDRDGNRDIVVTTKADVAVISGNGDATFKPPAVYRVTNGDFGAVVALSVADLDRDSRPDVVVAQAGCVCARSIDVLPNDGIRGLRAPVGYPVGPNPVSAAVADINGDGAADLAVATIDGVSILTGDGRGAFAAGKAIPIAQGAAAVGLGDFNGDGTPDMAVGLLSTGTTDIDVFTGDGAGGFEAATIIPSVGRPDALALGDFDANGTLDLAAADFQSSPGRVAVVLNATKPPLPTSKEKCKNRGWRTFAGRFENQGQCVAFVERGPKPTPGPTAHP